jgi:hypothetical protein
MAYTTPDVYVKEISLFPPSVAEVGTAIPAFIGYTAKAQRVKADDLLLRPTRISSLQEYEQLYGLPAADKITVAVTKATGVADVTEPAVTYLLYWSVKLYFDNGGGVCYITSVGTYKSPAAVALGGVQGTVGLQDGLAVVSQEDEPTIIVIPEAIKLKDTDYAALVKAVLLQCGKLGDRFGVFDLFQGDKVLDAAALGKNREHFGTSNLKYGAAYYPFIKSNFTYFVAEDEKNVKVKVDGGAEKDLTDLATTDTTSYNLVKAALTDPRVTLPASGAVAGVYAATDAARGVWKAPANVSLNDVIEPVVRLDSEKQGEFNVDATSGKSINAIRAFAGKGVLIWGARTLAGNDNEWRYVSVRRFFNMVEESVKKSTYWAVFEPNDANTWVKVRGMIESYLTDKWREGALAGATPKDAFYVRCGLGTTMNAQDILQGLLNVEIGMAVVRPAEFIVLKFSHKLQTS